MRERMDDQTRIRERALRKRGNAKPAQGRVLIVAAAALVISSPVAASYYNATFDCGHGQTVWIANPVIGPFGSKERGRKLIFEITLSNFDLSKVISPIVRWDSDKNKLTLDGRLCREMTEDEVNKLNKLKEGED
jgi:hypothetical protein